MELEGEPARGSHVRDVSRRHNSVDSRRRVHERLASIARRDRLFVRPADCSLAALRRSHDGSNAVGIWAFGIARRISDLVLDHGTGLCRTTRVLHLDNPWSHDFGPLMSAFHPKQPLAGSLAGGSVSGHLPPKARLQLGMPLRAPPRDRAIPSRSWDLDARRVAAAGTRRSALLHRSPCSRPCADRSASRVSRCLPNIQPSASNQFGIV